MERLYKNIFRYESIHGFSATELMVSLCLIFVLSGLGVPQFNVLRQAFTRSTAIAQFSEDVRIAQLQSVTEGGRGIFIVSGNSYSFGYDYLPYDTTDPVSYDTVADDGYDGFQYVRYLPDLITGTSTGIIIFDSKGRVTDKDGVITNHTITLSDSTLTVPIFSTMSLTATGVLNVS